MSDPSQRLHTFFVVKEPGRPDRIVVWDTQDISLGRSAENDLVIDHAEVSRRQAVFNRLNSAYVLKNLSTSNPTYVNEQPVKTAQLDTKDRIRVAETELIFYQVAKNPATLGAKLEYASQLKGFGGAAGESSPDATMLGMGMMDGGDEDELEIRPAGDFDYDLHDMGAQDVAPTEVIPQPRNLDLELGDPVLGGEAPQAAPPVQAVQEEPSEEAWELENPLTPVPPQVQGNTAGTFSVHLEIDGLTPDQQRFLVGLLGKVIQLPSLKIRLKGDDF